MEESKRISERIRKQEHRRIVVTDGDITILKFIHDFRLLRIRDLELLTTRKYRRLHGRLKGLFDSGYLGRINRPLKKDIYYITRPGRAALLVQGLITDEEADRRVREHELKNNQFLDHELMIADLHVLLTLATRNSSIELTAWMEGKEIHDSFEAFVDGRSQVIQVEPDAFFTIREATGPTGERWRRSFMLEADRGSMPKKERPGSRRMDEKIRKYEHYIREDQPRKNASLEAPHVRVLTIGLTRRRRDSLAASATSFVPDGLRKFFLFGSLEDLPSEDPSTIFNPVFIRPGDAEPRRQLLPQVAEKRSVLK